MAELRAQVAKRLLALAAPFVLSTLFTVLGRHVLEFPLGLFQHFAWHQALGLFILTVGFLVLRAFGWGALCGLCLLPHVLALMPLYLPVERPAAVSSFRLMHFNINTRNEDADAIFRFISESDPDVALLVEVGPKLDAALRRKVSGGPYRVIMSLPAMDNFGIAMLAKQDPLWTRVDRDTFYGLHTLSAAFELAGSTVEIVGLHVLPPVETQWLVMQRQHLDSVAGRVRTSSATHRLVMGDFNATPFSEPYLDFVRASGLRSSALGFGYMPTWPAPLIPVGIPIDDVAVSPSLSVVSRAVGPSLGSDHAPLVVVLAPSPR